MIPKAADPRRTAFGGYPRPGHRRQGGGAHAPGSKRPARALRRLDNAGVTLKLSVLDQSPVISGHTPAEAVHATLELARAA